jgi:hypothetical protein
LNEEVARIAAFVVNNLGLRLRVHRTCEKNHPRCLLRTRNGGNRVRWKFP